VNNLDLPKRITIEKQDEIFHIILTKQTHERVIPVESWEKVLEILKKESQVYAP